jgi:hypothetical protein
MVDMEMVVLDVVQVLIVVEAQQDMDMDQEWEEACVQIYAEVWEEDHVVDLAALVDFAVVETVEECMEVQDV